MKLPSRERRRALHRHWIKDPLAGLRMNLAHEALRALPAGAASRIGGVLGPVIAPRANAGVDRRIRQGLRALRPDLVPDAASLDAAAGRVWASVARAYAEFSIEDRVWSESRVVVNGEHHVEVGRGDRGPMIVTGVHTGNWELVSISLAFLGHDIVHVYQPPRNRFEAAIAERARRRAEARVRAQRPDFRFELVAPSPASGFQLVDALRTGATLVIFSDESVGGRVRAPFFGVEPRLDGNMGRIMRLARLTGAEVVVGHCLRDPRRARYSVRFSPPTIVRRTQDGADDLRRNVATLNEQVASIVLEHLLEWYMLVDYSPGLLV